MMESLDERYVKDRRTTTKQPGGASERAGSNTGRGTMVTGDEQFNAAGGILIDFPTLKKLLNRVTCEFILSLIHGTAVAPGMIQSTEKSEKDSQV